MLIFKQKISKRLCAQDGITAIEFAMVAPVLFLLMMGILEFSMIMFATTAMESATTTTARLGKTGYTAAGTTTRSQQIVQNVSTLTQGLLDPNKITITAYAYASFDQIPANAPVDPAQDFGNAGDIVVYTVSYPWTIMTPLVSAVIGKTFTIQTRTVVKNEPYGS